MASGGTLEFDAELDTSDAEASLKSLENSAEDAGDAASSSGDGAFEKVKSGAKEAAETILNTLETAIEQIGDALSDITQSAVEEYAEYEQMVGGVEKLFDESADKVLEYADNAYLTAQMSANDYLETVTTFSATLIDALGDDTEAAADYAELAVEDMADNANTFGTDIEVIEKAYEGFMKNNYTMLDNLKLGYAGTQDGMKELIEDANELKEAAGETGDLEYGNFADTIEAIHLIQEELGITGTTAEEALGTVQGSFNLLQATWDNWLTGLGDADADIGALTDNLVYALGVFAGNLGPVLAQVVESLTTSVADVLTGSMDAIEESLVQSVTDIWNSVASFIKNYTGISLPTIDTSQTQAAFDLVTDAADSAWDALSDILGRVSSTVVNALDSLSPLAETIVSLFDGVADGWASSFEGAMDGIDAVFDSLDPIIESFSAKFAELGIDETFKDLGDALGDVLSALGDCVGDFLDFGDSINIGAGAATVLNGVLEAVVNILDWVSEHMDLVLGVVGSLATAFAGFKVGSFLEKLSGVVETAMTAKSGIVGLTSSLGTSQWGLVAAAIAVVISALVWFFSETELGQELWSEFTAFLSDAWTSISNLAAQVWPYIQQLITTFLTTVQTIWNAVWPTLEVVVTSVWTIIQTIISTVLTVIQTLIDTVLAAINGDWGTVWTNIQTIAQTVWNGIQTIVQTAINAVSTVISNVLTAISNVWSSIWTTISNFVSNIWTNIKTAVSNAVNTVKTTISNKMSSIKTTWQNAWTTMKNKMNSIWSGIKSGVTSGTSNVLTKVSNLKTSISNKFSNASTMLLSAGKQIVKGLANGISNGASWVQTAINNVCSNFVSGVKSFFGIKSPSKLMAEYGGYLMAGLRNGIEDEASSVLDEAEGVWSDLGGAFSDADGIISLGLDTGLSGLQTVQASGATTQAGTTINQTFETKVVRSSDDLYTAVPTIVRGAIRSAT